MSDQINEAWLIDYKVMLTGIANWNSEFGANWNAPTDQ